MNDKQKVAYLSMLIAASLVGMFWLLGYKWSVFHTDKAFMVGLPVIIAVAVLAPALRGIRK